MYNLIWDAKDSVNNPYSCMINSCTLGNTGSPKIVGRTPAHLAPPASGTMMVNTAESSTGDEDVSFECNI